MAHPKQFHCNQRPTRPAQSFLSSDSRHHRNGESGSGSLLRLAALGASAEGHAYLWAKSRTAKIGQIADRPDRFRARAIVALASS
jgi:hypothetical protein